jgi:alkylation response protein AidB-like acyl-CoA dehydrogenase
MFVGLAPSPDYLWTLARLQRGADSRETVTASFLVPAGRKGITLATSRRLIDGTENPVQFSEVRVPRSCMLGQEGNGWLLMGSSALEEQALRHPQRSEETVEALLRYADETCRDGLALSEQQVYQQLLMEAYTNSRLLRLYRTRDAWIRDSGSEITYQEAQTRLWERRTALRLAEIVREVVGLYALLDDRDPRSPATGKFEAQQRKSLALNSQAIEMEGDMNAVARQLGLGRRREEGPGGQSADVPPGVRVPR